MKKNLLNTFLFLFLLAILGFLLYYFLPLKKENNLKPIKTTTTSNKTKPSKETRTEPKQEETSDSLDIQELFDGVEPKNYLFTLVATGDYIPARSVNYKSIVYKDFTWAVKDFAPLLNSADIALINLEAPLLKNCPITNEGFTFCGTEKHLEGLAFAGIDIACMANNHASNYGASGLRETKTLLSKENIQVCGTIESPIAYLNIKNKKISFVAFNDIGSFSGVLPANDNFIKRYISLAKETSDIVIVSFHWGTEYTYSPTERQIDLVHKAVDLGASLVVGNHPHWIQPVEKYKDSLIVYAHGNFIFDQMWSEETKQGIVGKYFFNSQGKIVDATFYPVYIKDYGKATIGDSSILNIFKNITLKFNNL